MDNHNSAPVETGASMDYAQHEKTYNMFLVLAKWTTIGSAAILILMAITLL